MTNGWNEDRGNIMVPMNLMEHVINPIKKLEDDLAEIKILIAQHLDSHKERDDRIKIRNKRLILAAQWATGLLVGLIGAILGMRNI